MHFWTRLLLSSPPYSRVSQWYELFELSSLPVERLVCAWEQVLSHWEVWLVMFWCFIGLHNLVYWLPILSVGILNWLCYINRCWKEDCQPVDVLNWLSCWNQWLKQWLTACYSLHYQTPSHEGLAQTTVTSTWRVGCRATFVCRVMFPVQWKHCCSLRMCGVYHSKGYVECSPKHQDVPLRCPISACRLPEYCT